MNQDIKYAVFVSQEDSSVGHFLNRKYYEPFGSDHQLGELDKNDNFVYYIVTPENTTPRIHGRLKGNTLIRETDGLIFQIKPV